MNRITIVIENNLDHSSSGLINSLSKIKNDNLSPIDGSLTFISDSLSPIDELLTVITDTRHQ